MAIVFPNNTVSEVSPGFTYPGALVQVVEQTITATLSFNNWATFNALGSASITPTSATSNILIYIQTTFRQDSTQGTWSLGIIALRNAAGTELIRGGWNGTWRHVIGMYQKQFLHSPGTTATQTYTIGGYNYPTNGTFLLNTGTASDAKTVIRLQEFAA
jgi:hypothetical protein